MIIKLYKIIVFLLMMPSFLYAQSPHTCKIKREVCLLEVNTELNLLIKKRDIEEQKVRTFALIERYGVDIVLHQVVEKMLSDRTPNKKFSYTILKFFLEEYSDAVHSLDYKGLTLIQAMTMDNSIAKRYLSNELKRHESPSKLIFEIYDYVIENHPALVLKRNFRGQNLLMIAVSERYYLLVELLVKKYPVMVTQKDSQGLDIYDYLNRHFLLDPETKKYKSEDYSDFIFPEVSGGEGLYTYKVIQALFGHPGFRQMAVGGLRRKSIEIVEYFVNNPDAVSVPIILEARRHLKNKDVLRQKKSVDFILGDDRAVLFAIDDRRRNFTAQVMYDRNAVASVEKLEEVFYSGRQKHFNHGTHGDLIAFQVNTVSKGGFTDLNFYLSGEHSPSGTRDGHIRCNENLYEGFKLAAEFDADVVNVSCEANRKSLSNLADKYKYFIVQGAGNSYQKYEPLERSDYYFSVTSVDANSGQPIVYHLGSVGFSGSNYGESQISVAAEEVVIPFVYNFSNDPFYPNGSNEVYQKKYQWGGTSSAAPLVSAVIGSTLNYLPAEARYMPKYIKNLIYFNSDYDSRMEDKFSIPLVLNIAKTLRFLDSNLFFYYKVDGDQILVECDKRLRTVEINNQLYTCKNNRLILDLDEETINLKVSYFSELHKQNGDCTLSVEKTSIGIWPFTQENVENVKNWNWHDLFDGDSGILHCSPRS